MSKESDDLEQKLKTDTKLLELIELDERKKALFEKELTLKEHRASVELDRLVQNISDLEKSKNVSFGNLSEKNIELTVQELEAYLEAARNTMDFICDTFKGNHAFFRKNLMLILADTGGGKSTAVANIVWEALRKINPVTGKKARILVLTNEEAREDFYARISCFIRGWSYTRHHEFTDEQMKAFAEDIPILANGGLTVIGDHFEGVSGWTTTFEGFEMIFENLIKNGEYYDAIVIDYYQNVSRSKADARLGTYECQEKFAELLDKYKNIYPGPIVVMAQINKPRDDEDKTPFNIRIKGRKMICDKSTYILEMRPNYELKFTKWIVHKSRFAGVTGQEFQTGYDKGRFVPWDKVKEQEASKALINKLEQKEKDQLPPGVIVDEKKEEK